MQNEENNIIQDFDNLTSNRQAELLYKLIEYAARIDAQKVLKLLVDRGDLSEVQAALDAVADDLAY